MIAAVLHVNQRAVVAVKELGVTRATATVAGFLKDEVIVTIAGENAGIRLALNEVGIGLHDRLEVNAKIGILLHNFKGLRVES